MSAPIAARSRRAGRAAAIPAASGTRSRRRPARRLRSRSAPAAESRSSFVPLAGIDRRISAHADRHRRVRPRARRRLRAGLGASSSAAIPGIGKSTILIQAAAALARAGKRVVYISGEEAIAQIRLRAEPARPWRRAGRARGRDACRGHPRDAGGRAARRPRRHRFDPDAVDRPRRERARARSRRCAPPRRR